jgi:hypothetical protein
MSVDSLQVFRFVDVPRPRKTIYSHSCLLSALHFLDETYRSDVMVKDTMSILLLYLWGLLGLGPLLSCHPVQGRELQSNNTVYVPGLFDLSTFDFGEEVSGS